MIKVNPYLNFNGNTEEAFNFYKAVFGGEFDTVMKFKDMPQTEKAMPANEAERIMHISLPIGGNTVLMGTDISEGMGMKLITGNNISISLTPDTLEEAQRLFTELSAGGKVEMPLEKMFWGNYFASFSDKFRVLWMINIKAE